MKKWIDPELLELGLESTKEFSCYAADKHPCHKTGNGEHGGNDNIDVPGEGKGHIASSCVDHEYCCCFGAPQS